MDDDPIRQAHQQEKKEFSTLLTLGVIYAIGTVGVIVAAVLFTNRIVN